MTIPNNAQGDPSGLPPSGVLQPFMDFVARVKTSVHVKLLAGFLVGALLLLAMGILSLVVINRMNQRVGDLTVLQEQVDETRQAIYLITSQSHFRAMALATEDNLWNEKITGAKEGFTEHLGAVAVVSSQRQNVFDDLREVDTRYAASGEAVLALYEAGDLDEALDVHIAQEHEISHELEDGLNGLIQSSTTEIEAAGDAFRSDRNVLTIIVASVSGVSLVSALFLGVVLSGAFVRPVRAIDHALARIAGGDFSQEVHVPNRDEFGTLSGNLNHMTGRLATLYGELRDLNSNLQQQVDEQVQELERATSLKRYLSPQVADSILAGRTEVSLASRRRNLTVFFSDIRGFTELSERLEPEELIDMLNQYLTAMTEIVFKHGGTLDKYIGDAIMVFFGDPIPYDDHAERAVKMALEMRAKLAELQERWFVEREEVLTVGMGISTGYVTVGNIGSSARVDYTVLGNHVNLASRLADSAGPGEILASERTMAAIRDLVDGSEVDQLELHGVNRPVRIFRLEERGT